MTLQFKPEDFEGKRLDLDYDGDRGLLLCLGVTTSYGRLMSVPISRGSHTRVGSSALQRLRRG